jgi:uncharacterized protein (DUF1778 family)
MPRQRGEVVFLRLTPLERKRLERAVELRGGHLTTWCREIVLAAARRAVRQAAERKRREQSRRRLQQLPRPFAEVQAGAGAATGEG